MDAWTIRYECKKKNPKKQKNQTQSLPWTK